MVEVFAMNGVKTELQNTARFRDCTSTTTPLKCQKMENALTRARNLGDVELKRPATTKTPANRQHHALIICMRLPSVNSMYSGGGAASAVYHGARATRRDSQRMTRKHIDSTMQHWRCMAHCPGWLQVVRSQAANAAVRQRAHPHRLPVAGPD